MIKSEVPSLTDIVTCLNARLDRELEVAKTSWINSKPVRHFFIDNLLPIEWVNCAFENFPSSTQLKLISTIRERKRVGIDYQNYHSLIGALLLGFQDTEFLNKLEIITGLKGLSPDPSLYASGVSLMEKKDFLNPHVDNSHDGDRKKYRVLNALFYCSPDWSYENGGNLELWEKGIANGNTILSKFNRLVVMATNKDSWHSVSEILADQRRTCISNYYFSETTPASNEYFHVTTYTGRPEEKLKGMVLKVDGIARNAIRKVFPKGIVKSNHRLVK